MDIFRSFSFRKIMQTRLHSDSRPMSFASLVKSIELYITRFVVLLQTKTLENINICC